MLDCCCRRCFGNFRSRVPHQGKTAGQGLDAEEDGARWPEGRETGDKGGAQSEDTSGEDGEGKRATTENEKERKHNAHTYTHREIDGRCHINMSLFSAEG